MSAGQVWIDNAVVTEGNAGTRVATFTVRRVGGSDAFEVSYATADGIALAADGDYVATSGVLHFGAGVQSGTISVTIKGDTKFELDEYFFLNLSGATNGAFLWQTQAMGTIATDDKTPAAGNVWINDSSIVEGNSGTRLMTFTVQRSGGSKAFSVNYATEPFFGATEGVDYVKKSGTLAFAAGETSKTITVEIKGDTAFEGNEKFGVVLSNATAGAAIIALFNGPGRALGTILDDDTGGRGVVSIRGPVSVAEGNSGTKVITFTVTRTGGTGAFSVDYSTSSIEAQAGTDYVQKAGTLQFAAGVDSQTISVTVKGDTSAEPDEGLAVFLSNPTNGAIIGQALAYTTIVNDDGPGPGEIWVDDATVTEGNSGTKVMTFTVSRSSGILPFSVSYQTQDGGYDPATGAAFPAATARQDYVAQSGVLQFAAGVMSRTVAITINGDTTAEAAENFLLALSNPTNGAVIRNYAGNGTIVDDDGTIPTAPGRVRIDNASVVEGNSGTKTMTFTATRYGGKGAFSVDYNTADYGASVVGGDYLAASGTLQFAAGVTSQTFTVAVKGDTIVEELKPFAVVLTNATNGAIIDRSIGYGLILDDDVKGASTSGDDTLLGTVADDTLDGGGGNDTLDGGPGADTMVGGAGDDTFYVDNAGDKTIEANGGGTDQVFSTASFSLAGQYVEKLTLAGSANIDATGNSLANTLTGNSGNNVLDGGTGADTMTGGAGNDTYYVDNAGDKTIEANGAGTDQVFSTVSFSLAGQYAEKLILTGSANIDATGNSLANILTGNSGNNALNGGTGNDVLNGGAGTDALTGGSGLDTFVFDSALAGTIDTVADFIAPDDTIQLDRSIFAAITTLGTLSAAAFFNGVAAHDASDRIIYNSATGNLLYDSDGTGANAAVQFARLAGAPAITYADFTVVA